MGVHGEDAAAAEMLRILAERQAGTRRAVARGALIVEAHAKLELSRKSHPPNTPTPSRPGEPPALISGDLRRSVRTRGPFGGGGRWEAWVGPTIVYGRIQELGGRAGNGATLPPRPYLRPALKAAKPKLRKVFGDAWAVH